MFDINSFDQKVGKLSYYSKHRFYYEITLQMSININVYFMPHGFLTYSESFLIDILFLLTIFRV